jgi:DNA-binding NtrC family response regulator
MYKAPLKGYQKAVDEFKRRFLTEKLVEHGGNRTRAAKALGMQRTYLMRLIREFGLQIPRPMPTRVKASSEKPTRDCGQRQDS